MKKKGRTEEINLTEEEKEPISGNAFSGERNRRTKTEWDFFYVYKCISRFFLHN